MGPPPPPGFGPPPPGFRPPPPPGFAPPGDSFAASSSTDASSSSTSGSSSSTASSTSTDTTTSQEEADKLFGEGAFERMKASLKLLASNPAFKHAGEALHYVMNSIASKDESSLTDVDKGAIQQAINQMKSLVNARTVDPVQANQLNGAIANLQNGVA